MISFIVNADDFGLDPRVNSEIARGISNGVISSATILANSDYLDDVIHIINQNPHISFGVHLNITSGRSLTCSSVFRQYGIVDENGQFDMQTAFRACPNANKVLQKAIEQEWLAQIYHLKEKGIVLSHVDGHHHCHSWYGLIDSLCNVLKETGIKRVRSKYRYPINKTFKYVIKALACNALSPFRSIIYHSNNAFIKTIGDDIYQQEFRRRLIENGFSLPDYFCSYMNFLSRYKDNSNEKNSDYSIELMIHPGISRFEKENELVLSQPVTMLFDNCQLINYNDINEKK